MSSGSFTFTIDGAEVSATDGQTILQACDAAGIYIPRLCYHPDLAASGTCRLCTCKSNGRSVAACLTPAARGMVIENDTPLLTADRRALIEMLFVEGNHPCTYCVASGGLRTAGAWLPPRDGGASPAVSMAGPEDRRYPP